MIQKMVRKGLADIYVQYIHSERESQGFHVIGPTAHAV